MSFMAEWEIDLAYDASYEEEEAKKHGEAALSAVGFPCDSSWEGSSTESAEKLGEAVLTFRGEGGIYGGRDFDDCYQLLVQEVPKKTPWLRVIGARWLDVEHRGWDEEFYENE